jgi:hypothetical protein
MSGPLGGRKGKLGPLSASSPRRFYRLIFFPPRCSLRAGRVVPQIVDNDFLLVVVASKAQVKYRRALFGVAYRRVGKPQLERPIRERPAVGRLLGHQELAVLTPNPASVGDRSVFPLFISPETPSPQPG